MIETKGNNYLSERGEVIRQNQRKGTRNQKQKSTVNGIRKSIHHHLKAKKASHKRISTQWRASINTNIIYKDII